MGMTYVADNGATDGANPSLIQTGVLTILLDTALTRVQASRIESKLHVLCGTITLWNSEVEVQILPPFLSPVYHWTFHKQDFWFGRTRNAPTQAPLASDVSFVPGPKPILAGSQHRQLLNSEIFDTPRPKQNR